MDPITISAVVAALLPAAADGVRGLISKVTGGAGAQPQNVGEAVQLMTADTARLDALARIEGNAESYRWVAAIRQLQRPVIAATVTVAWVVVTLGTYDDFTRDMTQAAASSVWFYLFGERFYMGVKGQKR